MATLNNVIANANGCVGIGTTTLLSKFVVSNGSSENFEFTPASVSFNGGIFEYINRATGATRPDFNFYLGGGGGAYKFYTQGNNERMRVAADGNIGIGTTSPVQKLSVVGNIYLPQGNYITWNNGDCDIGGVSGYHLVFRTYTGVSMTEKLRIQSDGNVGIGTTTPSSKLHISNTTSATRITITDDVANGRSGYIESNYSDALVIGTTSGVRSIKFAPDNSTAMTIAVGTNNVGIGTTSPADKLEVDGGVRLRSGNSLTLRNATNDSSAAIYNVGGSNGSIISFAVGPTPTMYVGSNVGIGTTSPSNTKLHIVADWVSGHSTIKVQGITDNTTGYGFYNTSGTRTGYIAYVGSAFEWYNNEAIPIIFYANGLEKMRIASDGNVGISTTSPGRPLEVKSTNIAIRMNNTSNTNAGLEYYVSTGTYFNWVLGAQYNVSDGFEITPSTAAGGTTYSSPKFVVKANGNVGIGTTSPASRLDVSGSINTNNGLNISRGNIGFTTDTTEFFIKTTMNGGAIRFRGNSGAASDRNVQLGNVDNNGNWTSYLIAEGGGNVGIGTTSPAQKLHVAGNARIDGIGAYGIVQSNWNSGIYGIEIGGVGNALWANGASYIELNNNAYFDSGGWKYANSAASSRYELGIGAHYWFTAASGTAGNDLTWSEKMRLDNNGNIGIGTSSPNTLLHVQGTNPFVRINNASTGDQGIKISYNNSDTHGLHLIYNPNNAVSYIDNTYPVTSGQVFGDIYFRQNVGGTMTTRMTIKADGGNVGIGTTNPSARLDVRPTTATAYQGTVPYQTTTAAILSPVMAAASVDTYTSILQLVSVRQALIAGRYAHGYLGFSTVDNSNISGILDAGRISIKNDDGVGLYSSTSMGFWTNTGGSASNPATERVRIASDGNVGIGTTSPAYKLDVVSGSMRVSSAAGAGEIYFGTTDSANIYLKRDNNYDLTLAQHASSGNALYLAGAGNVYLSIDSNDNETTAAFIVQNNSIKSGSELFRVNEAGNVGIGSSSPSAKLDVVDAGNFFVTRDASGYARFTTTNGSAQLGLFRTGTSAGGFYIGGDASVFSVWDSSFSRLVNINTSGNIGINVVSPLTKLDIANTQANGITMRFDTSTSYQAWIRPYWNSTTDTRIDFAINRAGGSTPDVIMSVGYGGNVGIGTTAPAAKLHISGSSNDQLPQLIVHGVGAASTFNWASTFINASLGSSRNYISLIGQALSTRNSGYIGFNHSGTSGSTTNFLTFGLYGVDNILNINGSGNVGIGTTSPLNKLHIVNDGNYRVATIQGDSNYTGVGGGQLRIRGNTNVNKTIEIGYNTSTDVGFIQSYVNLGSAQPICLNPDGGSVGIGTISPAGKLEVRTNAASTYVFTGTSTSGYTTTFTMDDTASYFGHDSPVRSLVLRTNSTIRLTIAGGGNVGIGTSNPTALLHNYRSTSTAAPITYLQEDAASPSKTNVLLIERLNNLGATSVSASSAGVRIREHSANYGLSVEDHSGNSYLAVRGGGNVGIGTAIPTSKLNAYGSGSNLSVFKAEGGNGTLFEVTDQLSGSLFSVNTIAGIPILEVFSNNTIVAGQYGSNALVISGSKVGIGLATPLSNKSLSISGDAQVLGSFTKASGTFLIDHPDPAKLGWKLQHSFVESPTVGDNIYRYVIDIDNTLSGSIELPSYWKFLNENPQIWISPVKHFGVAYGELNEELSIMNVYANNVGKYNILLIGTRKDPTIKHLMPDFNVEFESQ